MILVESQPTLQRKIFPLSSGLKIKPGKNDHETGKWLDCCPFHVGFLLDLLFNPEDGSVMFLWKVGCLHGVISQKT
jgi:hypothetical protein